MSINAADGASNHISFSPYLASSLGVALYMYVYITYTAPENQEEVMSKFIDAKYLPVRYGGKDSSCGLCTGDAASLKNQDGQPSQAALDIKPEGRAKKVLSSAFYKEMDEHMAQLQAEHEKKTTAESSTSLASYIGNGKMSSSRPHGWSWRKKERE